MESQFLQYTLQSRSHWLCLNYCSMLIYYYHQTWGDKAKSSLIKNLKVSERCNRCVLTMATTAAQNSQVTNSHSVCWVCIYVCPLGDSFMCLGDLLRFGECESVIFIQDKTKPWLLFTWKAVMVMLETKGSLFEPVNHCIAFNVMNIYDFFYIFTN